MVGSGGEIGHGDEKLANWISIYIGYDEEMNLLFITDIEPFSKLKANPRRPDKMRLERLSIQRELDPRVRWLEELSKDQ